MLMYILGMRERGEQRCMLLLHEPYVLSFRREFILFRDNDHVVPMSLMTLSHSFFQLLPCFECVGLDSSVRTPIIA